jgi:NAD(P)-dependent dehydrogenase (short-subunit alcohol dehydrogenase family)
VYLGSRNRERGEAAIEEVKPYANQKDGASVELVLLDVSNDESVQDAADQLKRKGVVLSALVNNAGTAAGFGHGDKVTDFDTMNVNLMGTKRCVDAFLDLLDPNGSRIVNVSSGSGPLYVKSQPVERQKKLCNPDITWDEILEFYHRGVPPEDPAHGKMGLDHYGLSKALLNAYTVLLARELAPRKVLAFSLSPGFIATQLTAMWPGGKPVEQGTISIKHCLFDVKDPQQSGWFFGSDAQRSPPHFLRNPGEPPFDGVMDWGK